MELNKELIEGINPSKRLLGNVFKNTDNINNINSQISINLENSERKIRKGYNLHKDDRIL